jgi:hypothetical protein
MIFSKEGTSAGPWMCVYVFQGLTVGWWKEERHREVSKVQIPRRMGLLWMFVLYFVLCCLERKKEKRRWAWVAGESTPNPAAHKGKKERKKQADRKVPDRPVG